MPSAYYITDAFMMLDRLLQGKLFVPSPENDKLGLAAKEAVKAKRCIGALRALWRSSEGAHDNRIVELKGLLEKSPPRGRRQNANEDWECLQVMASKKGSCYGEMD